MHSPFTEVRSKHSVSHVTMQDSMISMPTLDVLCLVLSLSLSFFFSVNPAPVDIFEFYSTSVCLAKTSVSTDSM